MGNNKDDKKGKKVGGKSKNKPSVFIKNPKIKIKAKETEYVVVLKEDGQPWVGHPVLEFAITNGPKNHLIDVQVARDDSSLLAPMDWAGPGLPNPWDKSKKPKERISQAAFSSWSNGDKSLALDGSGKATYKMPPEWWQDQARRPRKNFKTAKMYYRVLAFEAGKLSQYVGSTYASDHAKAPMVKVKNNLVGFKVDDLGYIDGGVKKSVIMEFSVREAGTTEMYTIVQWNKGSNPVWGGPMKYAPVTDYGIDHDSNIPEWAIDRLRTNPRYRDGNYNVSADMKTANTTDKPGGAMFAGYTHDFFSLDFETRLHLNFEVPPKVKIKRKEGKGPIYGIVIGVLDDPQPHILDSAQWKVRILQVKKKDGSVDVSRPETFKGP